MQQVYGADSSPSPAIKVKDVSSLLFLCFYRTIFMPGMSVPVPILYEAEQVWHGYVLVVEEEGCGYVFFQLQL
jgi:hypothetical protein